MVRRWSLIGHFPILYYNPFSAKDPLSPEKGFYHNTNYMARDCVHYQTQCPAHTQYPLIRHFWTGPFWPAPAPSAASPTTHPRHPMRRDSFGTSIAFDARARRVSTQHRRPCTLRVSLLDMPQACTRREAGLDAAALTWRCVTPPAAPALAPCTGCC
jgi:hypothetical protein